MRELKKIDGTPYPRKLTASGQAALIAKKEGGDKRDYLVKEVDGGFVIMAPELPKETQEVQTSDPVVDAGAPEETAEALEATTGEEPAKKHRVTKPWKPSRKLDIPEGLKDPRFDYRFVNKDKQGRVRQLENDGYEVDTSLQKKMSGWEKKHGKNLDSTYQINELIVMRILKTERAEHRKYYADLTNGAHETHNEEMDAQLSKQKGISMYIPKEAQRAGR
jgi:hypothetical protein